MLFGASADSKDDIVIILGVRRREPGIRKYIENGSEEGPDIHLGTLLKLAVYLVELRSHIETGTAEGGGKAGMLSQAKIGQLEDVFSSTDLGLVIEYILGLDVSVAMVLNCKVIECTKYLFEDFATQLAPILNGRGKGH
jgi:hypothetical protein